MFVALVLTIIKNSKGENYKCISDITIIVAIILK